MYKRQGGDSGHEANSDIDCNGDCFGTAFIDTCGVCSGGNSGHEENTDIQSYYFDLDEDNFGARPSRAAIPEQAASRRSRNLGSSEIDSRGPQRNRRMELLQFHSVVSHHHYKN